MDWKVKGRKCKSLGAQVFRPGVRDLRPGVRGLRPGVRGLRPGVRGLRPGVRGLRPGVVRTQKKESLRLSFFCVGQICILAIYS
jgi:hypothetical protein